MMDYKLNDDETIMVMFWSKSLQLYLKKTFNTRILQKVQARSGKQNRYCISECRQRSAEFNNSVVSENSVSYSWQPWNRFLIWWGEIHWSSNTAWVFLRSRYVKSPLKFASQNERFWQWWWLRKQVVLFREKEKTGGWEQENRARKTESDEQRSSLGSD